MPPNETDKRNTLFNMRIHAEGRRDQWLAARAKFKEAGADSQQAFELAAQWFPPLNGDDSEHPDPRENDSALEQKVANVAAELGPIPNVVVDDGKPEHKPDGAEKATKKKHKTRGPFHYESEWDSVIDAVPPGKKATQLEQLSWVQNNVYNRPSEIDIDLIPCRGALVLLHMAQSSATGYGELLTLWSKTFPTQQALKFEAQFTDDGRRGLNTIADFEKSLDDANRPASVPTSPERPETERGLS